MKYTSVDLNKRVHVFLFFPIFLLACTCSLPPWRSPVMSNEEREPSIFLRPSLLSLLGAYLYVMKKENTLSIIILFTLFSLGLVDASTSNEETRSISFLVFASRLAQRPM